MVLEFTIETYDKLIEMMRSSNTEDFFLGISIYKQHTTSKFTDLLFVKSFGESKRKQLINENITPYNKHHTHTLSQLKERYKDMYDDESVETKIINRLYDEYNKN